MLITKLRSHRVFEISLFDVILAWIGLYFTFVIYQKIKPITYQDINNPAEMATLLLFPVSILSHVIFNVPTELNYKLGISKKPIR
jgi:hypothetical protein